MRRRSAGLYMGAAVSVIVLAAGLALAAEPGPGVSPEKRAEIEKILRTTHALDIGRQFSTAFSQQMADMLRASRPDAPRRAFELLPEVVDTVIAENLGPMQELLVEVYDRHFTLAELRGLNEFYATELGAKLVATMPALVQESMAAGQKWGETLGPIIGARLDARFEEENLGF